MPPSSRRRAALTWPGQGACWAVLSCAGLCWARWSPPARRARSPEVRDSRSSPAAAALSGSGREPGSSAQTPPPKPAPCTGGGRRSGGCAAALNPSPTPLPAAPPPGLGRAPGGSPRPSAARYSPGASSRGAESPPGAVLGTSPLLRGCLR